MAAQIAEWKGPLKGHGLLHEGWPYNEDGTRSYYGGAAGKGRCSCGALGPEVASDRQRQKWHRQHKAEMAECSGG